MKYFVTVLLLCAYFLNLATGNGLPCTLQCVSPLTPAARSDQSTFCKAVESAFNCAKTCGADITPVAKRAQYLMQSTDFSCDLSGIDTQSGSDNHSGTDSLLTVLSVLLLTAYRALSL